LKVSLKTVPFELEVAVCLKKIQWRIILTVAVLLGTMISGVFSPEARAEGKKEVTEIHLTSTYQSPCSGMPVADADP